MIICPNCKEPLNSDNEKFCPVCYYEFSPQPKDKEADISLEESDSGSKDKKKSKVDRLKQVLDSKLLNNKKNKTLAIVFGVLILVFVIMMISHHDRTSKNIASVEIENIAVTDAINSEPENTAGGDDSVNDVTYTSFENNAINDDENSMDGIFQDDDTISDTAHNGIHEYIFVLKDCTWTEAIQYASSYGKNSHLLHINNGEEYEYVIRLMHENNYENKHFWVGGSREFSQDGCYHWIYIEGEDDEYLNVREGSTVLNTENSLSDVWMEGEPSNYDFSIEPNTVENSTLLLYRKDSDTWKLNDVADDVLSIADRIYSGKLGYIVEIE